VSERAVRAVPVVRERTVRELRHAVLSAMFLLVLGLASIVVTDSRVDAAGPDPLLASADSELYAAQGAETLPAALPQLSAALALLQSAQSSLPESELPHELVSRAVTLAGQASATEDSGSRLTMILDARADVIFARALLNGPASSTGAQE